MYMSVKNVKNNVEIINIKLFAFTKISVYMNFKLHFNIFNIVFNIDFNKIIL